MTPSCTALSGPLSTTAGTVLLGQIVTDAEEATVMLNALVTVCDAESLSRTVKLYEPAVVGVPLIAPLVLNVRPGGSDPLASRPAVGKCPTTARKSSRVGCIQHRVGQENLS